MTQRTTQSLKVTALVSLFLCFGGSILAADPPAIQSKIINFQGFLTNNAQPPVPLDGAFNLTFRLYAQPGELKAVWTEAHPNTLVTGGNISVLLGSIVAIELVFSQPYYLGVQVGTDPEMTPRQQIVPAFHAQAASTLVVKHADQTQSEFNAGQIVPVGGIISYFGDPGALPSNWQICNGSKVNDPQSPLNGVTLPDLRSKFVRGAQNERRNLTIEPPNIGGADTVNTTHTHSATVASGGGFTPTGAVAGHVLTQAEMPTHTHTSPPFDCLLREDDVGWPTTFHATFVLYDRDGKLFPPIPGLPSVLSFGRLTDAGSSGPHSHDLAMNAVPEHYHGTTVNQAGNLQEDNRPAFVALHFIIRIK